jgi:DNA-directed RNA polymerase subunit M/transcription elongation factor TFIIS
MSMTPFRINGKNALRTVLKQEKNIDTIEKYIYQLSSKNKLNIEENYNSNLYQIIGDIIDELKLKTILENIKNNKIGWEHHSFDEMNICIAEQNDFIKNPFEVEEGVFQCKQCGSKRVYSYAKQDRSCDEGTSVYAQCVACKAKWRERG